MQNAVQATHLTTYSTTSSKTNEQSIAPSFITDTHNTPLFHRHSFIPSTVFGVLSLGRYPLCSFSMDAEETKPVIRTQRDATMEKIIGYLLVALGCAIFFLFFFITVLTKVFPSVQSSFFWRISEKDTYYCILLPFLVPVGTAFVYFNWVCMKVFRHN
jgi:phosphatidylinositol N-acetylglucosaminyltransferase subunit Y